MELWTIQMGKWRLAKALEIPLIDTTVKSGLQAFAPTWELVRDYKSGHCSERDYTAAYVALMRESWVINRNDWEAVLALPRVALACYCAPNTFCHRLLLKEAFKKLCQQKNIPFVDRGELENATPL
jgi:hypothetical protein